MSVQEDQDTIQPWRQANRFTITSRGHWSGIPDPATTVTLNNYDPYAVDSVSPQIREIASDGNYNTYYDSFYAPVDFQMTGIAFKVADFLPQGVSYRVRIKVNGSQIELVEIPENEDYNQKQMAIECSSVIYEDDFIELEVVFNGNKDLLVFNNHNMTFSIGGCMWYGMYKGTFADETVDLATTENITISGIQIIDSVLVEAGDSVLVKNQTTSSENGIYIVSGGSWVRDINYPTAASLNGISINVEGGATQSSADNTLYTLDGEDPSIPLIEWDEGDKWFKTNIHLQNRSGNEILTDRVIIDSVKSTHNFLFQGITIGVFEDPLMITKRLKKTNLCLFVDVLVNGKSILASVGFSSPIQIDTDDHKIKEYDLDIFNDTEGYPIRFGDVISLKLYQRNPFLRTNGKIIQAILYGCGPDCATLDNPLVSVYEPCGDTPCEWNYTITDKCDAETAKESRKNPTVSQTVPSLPSDKNYVTVDGIYVTINGERIWI